MAHRRGWRRAASDGAAAGEPFGYRRFPPQKPDAGKPGYSDPAPASSETIRLASVPATAQKNMAVVRHFAINLVRTVADKKSIKLRRKAAAWDVRYLAAILRLMVC